MNNNLDPVNENIADYAHRFVKSVLGAVPFAGTALGEFFSVLIPSSIEARRDKWMAEVSSILNDLLAKNENLFFDLKENEEFISLLLDTSQLALKTHKEEKLKLYSKALKNSLSIDLNFFIQETFVRYIEELNPSQVSILKFIDMHQEIIIDVNSYQKYYELFTKGAIGINPIIDTSIDSSTVRFFILDLDKKGLLIISDALEELDDFVHGDTYIIDEKSRDGLPYINITEFGKNFLKMIEDVTE